MAILYKFEILEITSNKIIAYDIFYGQLEKIVNSLISKEECLDFIITAQKEFNEYLKIKNPNEKSVELNLFEKKYKINGYYSSHEHWQRNNKNEMS